MKNTKRMYPGCLYLFEGQASSSSCFIQSEEDAKSFIFLSNLYLKDFLKIHEYNLTKDGWLMIVSLRSREKIFKSYKLKRERSKTCNRKNDHTEIWKIISEQMRQFLKQYVYEANRRSGREGSLVKAPYRRSLFETIEEVKEHIKELRNQILKRNQKLKKYRGRKKFFKLVKNKVPGHIYLCSKWKDGGKRIRELMKKIDLDLTAIIELSDFMSLKIFKNTLKHHLSQT